MKRGFTLVELLVVVAIIVILLALLMPGMEKAIYQAELAVCGARHRVVASGVTTYAMDYKRHYPYRQFTDTSAGTVVIGGGNGWASWVGGNVDAGTVNDDRPKYRPYFAINKALNCPLIRQLDFELGGAGRWCSYNLWFGFAYHNPDNTVRSKGMFKLGDRLQWDDTSVTPTRAVSSSLLSGTRYIAANGQLFLSSTHPDKLDKYSLAYDGTLVRWDSTDLGRGPLDLNFSFADLSVRRYDEVEGDDTERMVHVPGYTNNGGGNSNYEIIPRQ